MIAQVATLLCVMCIAYLFWVDRRSAEGVSGAIWIPLLWMFFSGSRFPTQWWALGPPDAWSIEAYLEGSPLDRNVFVGLIVVGIAALAQRKVNWSVVLTRNVWLFLFLLFAASSSLWSDDPFVSSRRWVKGLGNVVMALVILTEERPYQALGVLLRRLAYLLIPLSVLFARYYPDLGRTYHRDVPFITGVTFHKNALGQLCLLLGVYFVWELLFRRRLASPKERIHGSITLIILPMLLWLLYVSNSATSIAAFMGAMVVLIAARVPQFMRDPRKLVQAAVVVAVVIGYLELFVGLEEWILRTLGRDSNLTDRKPVWELLMQMAENPWIGTGYEMFMSGSRLAEIWERLNMSGGAGQAHNGYIDAYLNLGIIGVFLLLAAILMGLIDAQNRLEREYAHAVLRIALILVAISYNYTEAAFKPLNNVFVLLLVSIIQVPRLAGKYKWVRGRGQPGERPDQGPSKSGIHHFPARQRAAGRDH
jgi:exopolysaccharide production protein ExoQ